MIMMLKAANVPVVKNNKSKLKKSACSDFSLLPTERACRGRSKIQCWCRTFPFFVQKWIETKYENKVKLLWRPSRSAKKMASIFQCYAWWIKRCWFERPSSLYVARNIFNGPLPNHFFPYSLFLSLSFSYCMYLSRCRWRAATSLPFIFFFIDCCAVCFHFSSYFQINLIKPVQCYTLRILMISTI